MNTKKLPETFDQHRLRQIYLQALGGDGQMSVSGLSMALIRDFGSLAQWRAQFVAMAQENKLGWVVLAWSSSQAKLVNYLLAGGTQLPDGLTPALVFERGGINKHLNSNFDANQALEPFMKSIHWEGVMLTYRAAVAADALKLAAPNQLTDSDQTQIIDVRHPVDFNAGQDIIEGAHWLDPTRVHDWYSTLDASKPVLVYCVKGLDIGGSTALALRAHGLKARYLTGGINDWRLQGLPLQTKGATSEMDGLGAAQD